MEKYKTTRNITGARFGITVVVKDRNGHTIVKMNKQLAII